jgi:hypothetical protein
MEMNRRDYSIENTTDYKIDIKVYNKFDKSFNESTSKTLMTKGEKLDVKIEQTSDFDINYEYYPFDAIGGDSLRLIFNDEKVLTILINAVDQSFSEPISRNILKHSNYQDIGNSKFLFKLTEQDYQNAAPCNGDCN